MKPSTLVILTLCLVAVAEVKMARAQHPYDDKTKSDKLAKEKQEEETEEDDEVLVMKNMDNEIRSRERLKVNDKAADKRAEKELATQVAPGCKVLKDGIVEVETEPSDVLRTKKFSASLTEDALLLNLIGSNPPQLYKRFSLPAIQMPLETLDRARDCFRLYYKGAPIAICGSDTTARNDWMGAIIEAVFCFNSGTGAKKQIKPEFEKGKAVKLPEKSTKEMRWKKLEQEREKEKRKDEEAENSVDEKPKGEEVSEIEIVGALSGSPKVTLNGEELPLSGPVLAEEEEQMGITEF